MISTQERKDRLSSIITMIDVELDNIRAAFDKEDDELTWQDFYEIHKLSKLVSGYSLIAADVCAKADPTIVPMLEKALAEV